MHQVDFHRAGRNAEGISDLLVLQASHDEIESFGKSLVKLEASGEEMRVSGDNLENCIADLQLALQDFNILREQ